MIVSGDAVFVPDCKLCTKLMNKRMQSLAQSQAAAIGSSVTLSADTTANSCQNPNKVWLPAPRGKWYTKEESFLEAKNNIEKLPAHSTDNIRDKAIIQHKMALNRLRLEHRSVADRAGAIGVNRSTTRADGKEDNPTITSLHKTNKTKHAQQSRVHFEQPDNATSEVERPRSVLEDRSTTKSRHWDVMNKGLSGAHSSPQFHRSGAKKTKTRSTKTVRLASQDTSGLLKGASDGVTSSRRGKRYMTSPVGSECCQEKSAEMLTRRSLQILEQLKQREKEQGERVKKRIENFLQDIHQFVSSS